MEVGRRHLSPQSVRSSIVDARRSPTESTSLTGALNGSSAVIIAKPSVGVVRDEAVNAIKTDEVQVLQGVPSTSSGVEHEPTVDVAHLTTS